MNQINFAVYNPDKLISHKLLLDSEVAVNRLAANSVDIVVEGHIIRLQDAFGSVYCGKNKLWTGTKDDQCTFGTLNGPSLPDKTNGNCLVYQASVLYDRGLRQVPCTQSPIGQPSRYTVCSAETAENGEATCALEKLCLIKLLLLLLLL